MPAQVLAEFSRVALRRFEPPLAPEDVYRQVEFYEQTFPILPLTSAIVLEAVRGHPLAYVEAQIWAAARLNQIPLVLSEDFSPAARVEGVTFLNPLDGAVELKKL